jgi:hypothetical protein
MRDFMHPHQAARAEKLRTAKLIHTHCILEIDPDELEFLSDFDLLCTILIGAEAEKLRGRSHKTAEGGRETQGRLRECQAFLDEVVSAARRGVYYHTRFEKAVVRR